MSGGGPGRAAQDVLREKVREANQLSASNLRHRGQGWCGGPLDLLDAISEARERLDALCAEPDAPEAQAAFQRSVDRIRELSEGS